MAKKKAAKKKIAKKKAAKKYAKEALSGRKSGPRIPPR